MSLPLEPGEVIGLLKPAVDAHTLGLATIRSLLKACGFQSFEADTRVNALLDQPVTTGHAQLLAEWIRDHDITRVGVSYRLDPRDAVEKLERLMWMLQTCRMFARDGGPIRAVYYAGLPPACRLVRERFGSDVITFSGDESDHEVLQAMGVPAEAIPTSVREQADYDWMRLEFGKELVRSGIHEQIPRRPRPGYTGYGLRMDSLLLRLRHAYQTDATPLFRAHVGPYDEEREAAIRRMIEWAQLLAKTGYLDILSLGTSQLTQSHFGLDWTGLANGGGVPVKFPHEYRAIREAARPMLVRAYSGTRNVPAIARVLEENLEIAWHALSLWWFSQLDGRGPNDLLTNLREHFETLCYIGRVGTPFEPNVPHHFMFRGADDVTYVVSGMLAARAAAQCGVRHFVLQTMLNTPRRTSGLRDLARARALLYLVRRVEPRFQNVWLQPRAGLDYFSTDLELAKAQLAAATALMDDIEPNDPSSPPIIHVVSYCEAVELASPWEVDESIRITRAALDQYRRWRRENRTEHAIYDGVAAEMAQELIHEAEIVLRAMEQAIPNLDTPEGLYTAFAAGFLPVPDLWHCRDQFPEAIRYQTAMINGAVRVVDHDGTPVPTAERAAAAAEAARSIIPSLTATS